MIFLFFFAIIIKDYDLWPLLSVEQGKDVFAGHEALLHISELQVVHL